MSQSSLQAYNPLDESALPIAAAHLDYLETVARLRGFEPTPAAQARVLELGCGVGVNLLALAERYPSARFVGIESAPRAVAMGRQIMGEIEARNVEFRRQDLAELDAELGTFDYIIAGAVYSWVDEPSREQLLAVCRDHLAPQGVALVGYKTYPGWAAQDMLRSMMRYEGRAAASTVARLARARMFLEFLTATASDSEPYGALVRGEAAALDHRSDAYLLHHHLQEISHPVYFADFARHAASYGLQTAGDGVLGIRRWDYLGAEMERQLDEITTDDAQREMFRDVVQGRGVRQTLLCHAGLELQTALSPERFKGLYLEGSLWAAQPEVDIVGDTVETFTNRAGTRVSTQLPLVKAALAHLSRAWPAYVRFEDCVAATLENLAAAGFPTPIPPEEIERLEGNLVQCCTGDVLGLHSAGPTYVTGVSDKPTASPLVRWQARRGEVVVNRRHEAVKLEPFERTLVDILDGARNLQGLIEMLAKAADAGELIITQHEQPIHDIEEARRVLAVALPETLGRLMRAALLVA